MNSQHAMSSRQDRAGLSIPPPLSALEEQIVELLAAILVEDVQAETVTEGTLSHRAPCKVLKAQ
jgi:hypothetical protein